MSVATMTSKGQVTIPVDIRRELGLEPGTKLDFVPQSGDTAVLRVRRSSLSDWYGQFAGVATRPGSDGTTPTPKDPSRPQASRPPDADAALGRALAADDERVKRAYREAAA